MNNKSFKTLAAAYRYFHFVNQTYVCFLIQNKEDDTYEVIDQELYDHYQNEFDLDMSLIDMYA